MPVLTFRFIRGKVSFADQSERENPPKGSSVVNILYGSKALRDAFSSVAKLYENFVGAVHFRVMSRLLGYQGIAMILEQMLNITEAQVGDYIGRAGLRGRWVTVGGRNEGQVGDYRGQE